jgi:hypothetical protein
MEQEENRGPSAREFELNMEEKMKNEEFSRDITALLRPEIEYDQDLRQITMLHMLKNLYNKIRDDDSVRY